MIGIDTNVLLRLIVADNAAQAKRVAGLIRAETVRGNKLFIGHIALCETLWAMRSGYGHGRDQLATTVDELLMMSEFVVENSAQVKQALKLFRSTRADFSDCLMAIANREAGCTETVSFDRVAVKDHVFGDV